MYIQELMDLANKHGDWPSIPENYTKEAFLIRIVETKLLELFSNGMLNGTVHTCVGQEFSAVVIAGQLNKEDWVTSNHRCHGHFIAKTKNWQGLLDELMGLDSGVCRGVGGSQHLYAEGFMSNGPQAALIPVATGIALHKKINKRPGIAVSFIGEGTLGEGVLYESFNLASLYSVPHLYVCENNFYSQSTPQSNGVSGSIIDRPKAFDIKVFEADTWDINKLISVAREAIAFVRAGNPGFLLVKTYRLNAHSKGDDNRDRSELDFFLSRDVLNILCKEKKWEDFANDISIRVDNHINSKNRNKISFDDYVIDQLPRIKSRGLERIVENPKVRMVQALNQAYKQTLMEGAFHIGEDISDPYGGAFKVTSGLSTEFPDQVRNTSISEAGLTGIAIGMALMGTKSFAEIMFGDFTTHIFDQIISNASKMYNMYGLQVKVPLRIRTPMGGKRGYGPTHSQSLEKHLLGIDNIGVISLTSLLNPALVIGETNCIDCPLVIIESKIDYASFLWGDSINHKTLRESKIFGAVKIIHRNIEPTLTVVSYGETARNIADNLNLLFTETDYIAELICVIQLHPLDTELIEKSVLKTRKIVIIEDGSVFFGFGSEVLSRLIEKNIKLDFALRVGAEPVPIPSSIDLELEILPTISRIIKSINAVSNGIN